MHFLPLVFRMKHSFDVVSFICSLCWRTLLFCFVDCDKMVWSLLMHFLPVVLWMNSSFDDCLVNFFFTTLTALCCVRDYLQILPPTVSTFIENETKSLDRKVHATTRHITLLIACVKIELKKDANINTFVIRTPTICDKNVEGNNVLQVLPIIGLHLSMMKSYSGLMNMLKKNKDWMRVIVQIYWSKRIKI